ncbi:hypothetical protein D9M71_256070 [compost metagenome]
MPSDCVTSRVASEPAAGTSVIWKLPAASTTPVPITSPSRLTVTVALASPLPVSTLKVLLIARLVTRSGGEVSLVW